MQVHNYPFRPQLEALRLSPPARIIAILVTPFLFLDPIIGSKLERGFSVLRLSGYLWERRKISALKAAIIGASLLCHGKGEQVLRVIVDLMEEWQSKEREGWEKSLRATQRLLSLVDIPRYHLEIKLLQTMLLVAIEVMEARKREIVEAIFHGAMATIQVGISIYTLSWIKRKYELINRYPELYKHLKTETQGNTLNLGVTSFMGGESVKGQHVHVIRKEECTEVTFKVTKVFRERMQPLVTIYKEGSENSLSDFLFVLGVNHKGVTIREKYVDIGKALEVTVEGVGKVVVGTSDEFYNNVNRVVVQTNSNNPHTLLSLVGAECALKPSTADEIERFKLRSFFRFFDPRGACRLESDVSSWGISAQELKGRITEANPEMKERLTRYYKTVRVGENVPGKKRFSLPAVSDWFKGHVLVQGVDSEESALMIARFGSLSKEMRKVIGLPSRGLSPIKDYRYGSSDQVFTQVDRSKYGVIQFVYSAEALRCGSYQTLKDVYGSKTAKAKEQRFDLVSFLEKLKEKIYPNHEVVIPDAIGVQYLRQCRVKSEESKINLIEKFRREGLLSVVLGKECFNNIPVDRFFVLEREAWN